MCCGSIRQAAKVSSSTLPVHLSILSCVGLPADASLLSRQMVGQTDASKLPDWAVRTICCNAGAACMALFPPGSRSSATLEEGSPALAPTPAVRASPRSP